MLALYPTIFARCKHFTLFWGVIIMRKPNVSRDEQIRLIMECRNSGLSDYQWCREKDILPGTFYNWIRRLRKSGYVIPDSDINSKASPRHQEVVKVNLVQSTSQTMLPVVGQNTSNLASGLSPLVAAEIVVNGNTVRLYNTASRELISSLFECMGGVPHAW